MCNIQLYALLFKRVCFMYSLPNICCFFWTFSLFPLAIPTENNTANNKQ